MKPFLFFLALLISTVVDAQKYYNARIIKKNGDVLSGKIELSLTPEQEKLHIKDASYEGKDVRLIDSRGKLAAVLKPRQISKLSFTYPDGREETWEYKDGAMNQVLWAGRKLSWYMTYVRSTGATWEKDEYWETTKGKRFRLRPFDFRTVLINVTSDKPELIPEIRALNYNYPSFLEILKKYDAL